MPWSDLGEWWLGEVESDPAYQEVVTPLLLELLEPEPGRRYLDLGSGEGRVMRAVAAAGAVAHGVEINVRLAARSGHPVIMGELPELGFLAPGSYDGAYCVLVLEHIADHRLLFGAAARVVRPGGILVVVMNHPTWTAPGSTPITDGDGEILWRPGEYFSSGSTSEPAGEGRVTFHHRSMAALLNGAAAAGWSLQFMVERPHHSMPEQRGIPRLLACRWRLLP